MSQVTKKKNMRRPVDVSFSVVGGRGADLGRCGRLWLFPCHNVSAYLNSQLIQIQEKSWEASGAEAGVQWIWQESHNVSHLKQSHP